MDNKQDIYIKNNESDAINIAEIINRVTPDFLKTLEERYNILRIIEYLEPIGRRSLSNHLDISERNVRTEANVLKDQGLIEISAEGMNITGKGKDTIEKLVGLFHELKDLKNIEEQIRRVLGIKNVFVVPDSVEVNPMVYKDIGRTASSYIKSIINNGNVIGLTGGTTVSYIVEEYKREKESLSKTIVVPARGGLGKKVEYQANTLVQNLASKIGCGYKTLYTPDSLHKSTIKSLKNEPTIKEIIKLIEEIDILVFGVGRADTMANRRGLKDEEIQKLLDNDAVSEAFGYYFDESGEIVHEVSTIGITLNKFKNIKNAIAVAAGDDKTEAIISVSKLNRNLVLITDESTAKNIILKYKEEN